jgi:hypothetical protein
MNHTQQRLLFAEAILIQPLLSLFVGDTAGPGPGPQPAPVKSLAIKSSNADDPDHRVNFLGTVDGPAPFSCIRSVSND